LCSLNVRKMGTPALRLLCGAASCTPLRVVSNRPSRLPGPKHSEGRIGRSWLRAPGYRLLRSPMETSGRLAHPCIPGLTHASQLPLHRFNRSRILSRSKHQRGLEIQGEYLHFIRFQYPASLFSGLQFLGIQGALCGIRAGYWNPVSNPDAGHEWESDPDSPNSSACVGSA
jgi:hypothetical protein